MQDLKGRHRFSLRDKTLLLLGAGGAARGLLVPLLAEGPKLLVLTNRTEAKALQLVQRFQTPAQSLLFSPWHNLPSFRFDLVIQATTAGEPQQPFPLPPKLLNPGAFCYDLVYGERHQPFLAWARGQGALCADGLGMLVEQAAFAFRNWLQRPVDTGPVLDELRLLTP